MNISKNMKIGFVGYGRFGAALSELIGERGYTWQCWDPVADLPSDHAAANLDGLLACSDLIIVAVPVNTFENVLRDLRPRLNSSHHVIDVCSVKQGPCRWMDEILGEDIPHAGCHPLFGPLSIARAEPLRTVLCPSTQHPDFAKQVRALFESLGSEVNEQEPAAHDRYMALTHAMAFFIARGLLDLGIDKDLHWAPPSFAALAASIAAVRSDAGHLFNAIQSENPYAASTRQQFIEALTLIDQRLLETPVSGVLPADMSIPDLGQPPPALQEVRRHESPTARAGKWLRDHATGPVYADGGLGAFVSLYLPGREIVTIRTERDLPVSDIHPDALLVVEGSTDADIHFIRERGRIFDIARRRYFEVSVTDVEGVPHFREGWYDPEGEGEQAWRWMSARSRTLLPARNEPATLSLDLEPVGAAGAGAVIEVALNGVPLDRFVCPSRCVRRWDVIPRANQPNELTIVTNRVVNPARSGISHDRRDLGLRLMDVSWSSKRAR